MSRGALSLYVHIPFCMSKCPYCDFYSGAADESTLDAYLNAVCARIAAWGEALSHRAVGTVYFGGGTPSVFGGKRLCAVLEAARNAFQIAENAEITAECNPADGTASLFEALAAGGFNRISMGMQSANEAELKTLGRRHTNDDVTRAVEAARASGFQSISLDLMLALPESDLSALGRSIDFAAALGVEHISSYILKIEPNTPFAKRLDLRLPDEDGAAEQYLFAVERLKSHGLAQYEISNFARPGFESRHNLQYWRMGEYLGIGPAAHSFLGGKRFFYPRDLKAFLEGGQPQADGTGGDFDELLMLALRLTEGLTRATCAAHFSDGGERFHKTLTRAARLPENLFSARTPERIALTPEGFLVSNAVIGALLN